MKSFFTYWLLICCCCLLACSDQGEKEGGAQETAKAAAPDRDSLRQAYLQFKGQRVDPLPETHIIEAGKLYPVDEAPLDTAFFVFRENLLRTVRSKDIFSLMEKVDENIKVSFGAENGLAEFFRQWELESEEKTKESRLWEVLEAVLQGGGTFSEGRRRFTAPYVFSSWPDSYDPFTHAAVTGAGVRMRETPSLNSAVRTLVSNDIVEFLGEEEKTETINGITAPWIHVRTLDGKEGYIWGNFIGRPIGYRAGFQLQTDGRWRMVLLVAGD